MNTLRFNRFSDSKSGAGDVSRRLRTLGAESPEEALCYRSTDKKRRIKCEAALE